LSIEDKYTSSIKNYTKKDLQGKGFLEAEKLLESKISRKEERKRNFSIDLNKHILIG